MTLSTGGLAALLAPLERLPPLEVTTSSAPDWLTCGPWRLFTSHGVTPKHEEVVAEFKTTSQETRLATVDPGARRGCVPFDPDEAFSNYVLERWTSRSSRRSLTPGQLQLFYRAKRFIPRGTQLALRRLLIRQQRTPEFPAWPADESVHRLLSFYITMLARASGRASVPFRWFWPDGAGFAAILTHDVESADGLRRSIEVADWEQERGLRSSFNVVADWYAIDTGILQDLRSRGFEIGVHGVHHDRSMFASRESFDSQQPAVVEAAERFGAVGFRSPATHRVHEWLADLPLDYDCTVPHSDPYEPQPGGCCSMWPFFLGQVLELPYTMPQDHTTFTLLRQQDLELWLRQLESIRRQHGLLQVVTHPDAGYLGNPRIGALYREFLDHLVGVRDAWHALPRDVAGWWRQRADGSGAGIVAGVATPGEAPWKATFARELSGS